MSKIIKRIFLLTVAALTVCVLTVSAQPVNIDTFLIESGFPQKLIDEMSIPQKTFIYESSIDDTIDTIEFCGYAEKEFTFSEDGHLIEANDIAPRSGSISSSDMTLVVAGVKVFPSNGDSYYTVYPAFKWHTHKMVANDSFAMNMYPGWEAIPGDRNLRLHLLNNQGESVQYVDLNPSQACSTGYSYKIPSNIGFMQGLYEGYARYSIDKTSSTASPRISLYYAHDSTSSFQISYNLSVSIMGISLTGDTTKIYTMADNFEVSGLNQ